MSEQALVDPSVIYTVTAAVFFLGTILFGALAVGAESQSRRYLLLATVPAAAMGIAYVLMSQDVATVAVTADREQSLVRFVGYTAVLGALVFVFKHLAGLSGRLFGVLLGVFVFTPWAALGSWLTSGSAETLMTVLVAVGYLSGTYLLFGPAGRQAKAVSGDRRLLFAKLRNLFVICWGALIVQSVVSEQALGLTDFVVGQITVSYTDAVLAFGIFGLVYAGKTAFRDGEGATGTPLDEADEQRSRAAVLED